MEMEAREPEGKLKAIKSHIACYIIILDIPGASNSKQLHRKTKQQTSERKNEKCKCIRFMGRVYIKERSNITAALPHTDKLRIQLQTTRPSPSPITILK
jgi:hypothetical protein